MDDSGALLAHVVDVLVIPDDLAGDDFLRDVFVTKNTLTCKHLHDVFNESAVKCDGADSVQTRSIVIRVNVGTVSYTHLTLPTKRIV